MAAAVGDHVACVADGDAGWGSGDAASGDGCGDEAVAECESLGEGAGMSRMFLAGVVAVGVGWLFAVECVA